MTPAKMLPSSHIILSRFLSAPPTALEMSVLTLGIPVSVSRKCKTIGSIDRWPLRKLCLS